MVKTYRVMDAEGGEIVCDIVRARNASEARVIVREAHLGERVRRYVVDEITAVSAEDEELGMSANRLAGISAQAARSAA